MYRQLKSFLSLASIFCKSISVSMDIGIAYLMRQTELDSIGSNLALILHCSACALHILRRQVFFKKNFLQDNLS